MLYFIKNPCVRTCCCTLGWGLCGALLVGVPMLLAGVYFAVVSSLVHGHAIVWSTILMRSLLFGSLGGCAFGLVARLCDGENPFAKQTLQLEDTVLRSRKPGSPGSASPHVLRRALWSAGQTSRTV